MIIKVKHISDTHSNHQVLTGEFDFVVHSGDWLPNITRGDINVEKQYQKYWLNNNADKIGSWLGGKSIVFCQGNHDFIDPDLQEELLRKKNINAYNATNKIVELMGIKFYGFPYINEITREWNYEKKIEELYNEVKKLENIIIMNDVDVVIAHSPPFSITDMDSYGNMLGLRHIKDMLDRIIYRRESFPDYASNFFYYMCGHIHRNSGIVIPYGNMSSNNIVNISNAATCQQLVEISK
jgi:Icc-related predicted phosphoesterase